MDNQAILQECKQRMQEIGMTLDELESASGVARSTLSDYLNGHRAQPTRRTVLRIAKALEVNVDTSSADDPRDAQIQQLTEELYAEREATRKMTNELHALRTTFEAVNEQGQKTLAREVAEKRQAQLFSRILVAAVIILLIAVIIFSIYAFWAYFTFDRMDPTQGLYRN